MQAGADLSTEAGRVHPAGAARRERGARAALFFVFLAASLAIYRPSFPGGPISDDYGLLLNPWVTSLDAAGVVELFDPRSQATLSLRNYAPVRPLVQALEWRLFGENGLPYHVVNAALHAFASWLLVLLLLQAGVALVPAALGGAFFLAHPAQVESIAWMSQIWTPLALCFGIAGLLAQRRRPGLAFALFVVALLTRPTAVCVLPVAVLRAWCWRGQPGSRARFAWLAASAAAFVAIAAVEFWIFSVAEAAARAPLHPDALVRLRTIVAIAGRYLARAATGHGVSAFQEVDPALSWLDPWWLLGLAGAGAIGARGLLALARDREEAAFWAWAPAAFLPISQIFPFLYPMADRYVYFLLPGLVGGVLLAGADFAARIAPPTRARVAPIATAAALAAIAALALWSHARAGIWVAEDRVLADAARHHPRGTVARLLEARRAAAAGDVDGAVAALEAARARGWDFYFSLLRDPAYEPVRGHPRFQALLETFAAATIETVSRRERVSQIDLRDLAEAHRLRGETAEAVAALERALALGGPLEPELRPALAAARARLRREDAAPAPP